MKLFSILSALLLCVAMILCCASCSLSEEDRAPDGMKLATFAGEDFRFYVPTVWNLNTAYGISGAYYKLQTQSTVSMVKYALSSEMRNEMVSAVEAGEAGSSIEWYWRNQCLLPIEAYSVGGSLTEIPEDRADTVLGGLNAKRYHATATVKGVKTHFVHVIGESSEAFYVFTLTVDDSLYAECTDDAQAMLDNFKLASPYEPEKLGKELKEDENTPSGMQCASNDDVAYRFYVPTGWEINRNETVFSARVPSDRSNVSVVPFMPVADTMTPAEFFALCQERMKNTAGKDGYELLGESNVTLGGRDATAYEYTYRVGEVTYRYKQVITYYKGMIYSLTYTALPEHYEAHLAEVDAIIAAFAFR